MNALEKGLESIQTAIAQQVNVVEAMVKCAYRSLRERCMGTAGEVLEMERGINESEIEIEEMCLTLLALQQPVATDLRKVAAALKINSELERIADLALSLAERSESLNAHADVEIPATLTEMVQFALQMLSDAKQAFLTSDANLARKVCESDSQLDTMNREIIDQILLLMNADSEHAAAYLHVFSASRIVERIGDLATNIAEDVEYVVEGEITRHTRHRGPSQHEKTA
ncbi:MAG: phosphate signaling complex protein PhoU [Planctomycetota bacterium]